MLDLVLYEGFHRRQFRQLGQKAVGPLDLEAEVLGRRREALLALIREAGLVDARHAAECQELLDALESQRRGVLLLRGHSAHGLVEFLEEVTSE